MGDMNMSGKRELMEYVPNYIVYDLETTGFSCNYDKIIEIAAIKVEGGKLADEFSALVWILRCGETACPEDRKPRVRQIGNRFFMYAA